MNRALSLATRGRGFVEPNPMVGCVLVGGDGGGKIIGEGWHAKVGGPHAEPTALADAKDRGNFALIRGCTAIVTLEPCCHTDKRTPPCTEALIREGISRVVVGTLDPNPKVNGKGINRLRDAGIEVITPDQLGDVALACRQLIAPFIAGVVHGRPYVTLKWAQDASGFVAGPGGKKRQISGPLATHAVHMLRSRSDAILIGGNTLRTDNPRLTARVSQTQADANLPPGLKTPGPRKPLRIVWTHKWPDERLQLFNSPEGGSLIVAGPGADRWQLDASEGLDVPADPTKAIAAILSNLYTRGVTHLLIEAGPQLAQKFFDANFWDRLWIIRSTDSLAEAEKSGRPAPSAPPAFGVLVAEVPFGQDVLEERLNTASPLFFAAADSADLTNPMD